MGCTIWKVKISKCETQSKWVYCDSGPESESAKFYRLQPRLRLQTKRSTPTDPNSGFDSDSAALVIGDLVEKTEGGTLPSG